MLDDVVGSFVDSLSERELDGPLQALLRAHGYTDVVLLHGRYEFGKDVIAKGEGGTVQLAFQSKAGDMLLGEWASGVPQLDLLRKSELAHPSFDRSLPRVGVLVLTGRLRGGAAPASQDYARQAEESGEPGFVVWDRGKLVELLTASLEAGLAGTVRGNFLELIGRIESGRVTEAEVETYSTAWISDRGELEWRSVLEAALVANRLQANERVDLACFTCLALLRGLWASAHGLEPVPATVEEQARLVRQMFQHYAGQLWERCGDELLDPRAVLAVESEAGVFVHYPVRCSRLLELLGAYGLSLEGEEERVAVARWLAAFLDSQPGATHPVSDRWATSLIPALALVDSVEWGGPEAFLQRVATWIGDRYEDDGSGLASVDASPQDEVDYLLGSALEDLAREPRGTSYLASVLLDLAAAFELADTYDLVYNDVHAVEARPALAVPDDNVSQYLVSGEGVEVTQVTDPGYVPAWSQGEGWRMASHHHVDVSHYYLGRHGRLWDQLAVSLVARDRHWIAGIRALLEQCRGGNTS